MTKATHATTKPKTPRKPSPETVKKMGASGWAYLHPVTEQWIAGQASREEARAQRKALIASVAGATQSGSDEETFTPEPETVTVTAEDIGELDTAMFEGTHEQAQNPLDSSSAPVVSSVPENVSSTIVPGEERMSITAKNSKTNKGGATLFGVEGLAGSIRFPKSLFSNAQSLPFAVRVTALDQDGNEVDAFAKPGAVKTKATTEEEKAKIIANAQKAEARAKKAADRAAKAKAKVDALNGAATPAEASA